MFNIPEKQILFLFSSKKKMMFFWLALCFILYGNSVSNNYSLDDDLVVTQNNLVKGGIKNLGKIFSSHYTSKTYQSYEYRPMVIASFAVEKELFGLNPHISHFFNIVLYACLLYLLYLNLNRWFSNEKKIFIFFTLLLFATHPIHSEVISNIKCRDELLAINFGLVASIYAWDYLAIGTIRFLIFAFLFSLLGFLSKLSVLPLLMVTLVSLFFFFDREKISAKKIITIIFLFALAFYVFSYTKNTLIGKETVRDFLFIENPLYGSKFNFIVRLKAFLITTGHYYKMFLLPFPLLFYYGYNVIEILNPKTVQLILPALVLLVLIAIIVWGYFKNKLISWSLVCFLIAIAPFSNFLHSSPGVVADRFLFIATIGGCALMAKGFLFAIEKNKNILFVFVLLILGYSVFIINRNADWKDLKTLAGTDIKYLENSAKANAILAFVEYDNAGKEPNPVKRLALAKQAINHYKKAVEIYPQYKVCYNNIGAIYVNLLGEYANAEKYFRQVIAIDSNYVDPYVNLASARLKQNDTASAITYFEKALIIAPSNDGLNNYLQQLKAVYRGTR